MGAVEQDMTRNEFAVSPITCYETMLCANEINIYLIKNQ